MNIIIRKVQPTDHAEWLRLRSALWPEPYHKISELKAETEIKILLGLKKHLKI